MKGASQIVEEVVYFPGTIARDFNKSETPGHT